MTRKHRGRKGKVSRKNYRHNLHANAYICAAFRDMMKGASKRAKTTYLYYLIRYCFRNISLKQSRNLTHLLYTMIANCMMDKEICISIFRFYRKLTADDFLDAPISKNMYAKSKIAEIETTITPSLLQKQAGTLLVDVGSGDCSIVKLLGDYGHMESVGVDLKNEIEWGKGTSLCDQITHILYDGTNLVKAVRERVGTKKVGIIMYNHALHHFGSPANIRHSLEQAYRLLSKDGVLFLREHDVSQTSDIDINLQHIFIHMRHVIDQHAEWDENDLWKYMNHHMSTFSAHFFTKQSLIRLCESIGFTLLNTQPKVPAPYVNYKEISTTTFFAFAKN